MPRLLLPVVLRIIQSMATKNVDAVKGLFQVYEMNVYLSIPFDTLLNDISEGENVVYAPYSWSKACLLFP